MGCELKKLNGEETIEDHPELSKFAWKTTSVHIPIPDRKPHRSMDSMLHFMVDGLYYRPFMEVIKETIDSDDTMTFHYTPFRHYWRNPTGGADQRVYDEMYTADSWIREQEKIDALPREDGDDLERSIVGMQIWSDATRLADFGGASFCPVYLYFPNQSKYHRGKPTAKACHHVAYIPHVSLRLDHSDPRS